MRRLPKQARSKAKVDAIVKAAALQLRNVGYEGLSTVDVAKQAGVSIGTLYQFFDNKDDLMQAIAEEHSAELSSFRTELFGADAVYVPAEILVSRTIDWLVDHNRRFPTFHQIFSGDWNESGLHDSSEDDMRFIVTDLAKIMRHHAPHVPEEKLYVGATVLVHITKGMFGLINSAEPDMQPTIIAEVKRMSLLYFNDVLAQGEES